MKLQAGQTAVVTGAASGIGFALASALVARGLNVVLADRDVARLDEAVAALRAPDGTTLAVPTDVSDPESVDALAAAATTAFGPVHLLANNAGVLRIGTAYEASLADWNATLGVNLFGIIHGYRSFVPGMLAHGQPCHVLNTASLGGLLVARRAAPYLTTKHAAIALSESLAGDLADTNLGVTVLCPGGVSTDIFAAEARRQKEAAVQVSDATQAQFDKIADPDRTDVDTPETIAAVALDAVERGELYAFRFPAAATETVRRRLAGIEQALAAAESREALYV